MPIKLRSKKLSSRKAPVEPQVDEKDYEEESFEDSISSEDFLMTGDQAETYAKQQAAERAREVREFFITKKELAASPTGNVEVRTHLCINYAEVSDSGDFHNIVATPCVTIPAGGGRFKTFTSPENGDCAFRAAGLQPYLKPLFIIMDHRPFKSKDGKKTYKDNIRAWRPGTGQIGQMRQAIRNLAENLGLDPDDPDTFRSLDVRDHVCKITKLGAGKRSTWSIDFLVAKTPLTKEQKEGIAKWFGLDVEKGQVKVTRKIYMDKMRRILAPDDKYLISKGGTYTPPNSNHASSSTEEVEEPPY